MDRLGFVGVWHIGVGPQSMTRDVKACLGTVGEFVDVSGVAWPFQFVFIIWV